MPTAITAIGNVIVGILQKLLENLPAMLQKGVELLTQLAAGIAQNAPAILSAIGDVIGRLLSTIASHLPQLLQKGIEMIGQLAAGLIRAVPQAIKGIGEVIKGIQNAFKQINWGELGRAIIDGIAAGLRNAGHVLMDAALNAARGAFDTVKSFFGISSPSKLMRDQIGVYIPAGIAEGIEDGSDDLDQSIEGMSTRMLRDITTDVNYNLPDMGDYAAQLGASINASASTQINVPLIVDGREIARATAWYTNQQLAWEAR
jgi:phage-related protein